MQHTIYARERTKAAYLGVLEFFDCRLEVGAFGLAARVAGDVGC
ncbi:MAG TPA: hypothetical protein VF741_03735 [Candidatus Aquilonibacter sp.]